MRASLLLASAALTGGLFFAGGRAAAQVDSTGQTKPELNALPPDTPLPSGAGRNQSEPQLQAVPPTGTFEPARPAQPTAVPAPARRPAPTDAGTPVAPELVKPPSTRTKWFVTGNPDLGFRGSNGYSVFNIGLTALFGYRITDRFAVGPGITYQYVSIKEPGFSTSYSNVGGRIFGQFIITEHIFAHAEIEALRTAPVDRFGFLDLSRRITVNSQFAGLGYRQPMGDHAAFDITVLYNFSQFENRYVYGQPEFRFNFLIDLFR